MFKISIVVFNSVASMVGCAASALVGIATIIWYANPSEEQKKKEAAEMRRKKERKENKAMEAAATSVSPSHI